MKVRLGFVSNSSSSSFLIIGSPCSGINDAIVRSKNGARISVIGAFLNEGNDVFEPDTEMLEQIAGLRTKYGFNDRGNQINFIDTKFVTYSDEMRITTEQNLYGSYIYSGEADNSSTDDMDDFKRTYSKAE